jgi:nonribosomal peptide synthetase DhbF
MEHWIAILRKFWADCAQTTVDQIAPDTDIFSTRADSFDIVHLATRIEAHFNVDLPDYALIEAPTPAEMAELIAEQPGALDPPPQPREGRSLLKLRSGAPGAPLAIVPGGNAWGLIDPAWLSRSLAGDRDVYGLHGQTDQRFPADASWLERVAASYRDELLEASPGTPWLITGICLGSPLAWETARLLAETGRPVRLLLFDPMHIDDLAGPSDSWRATAIQQCTLTPADLDLTIIASPLWAQRGYGARYRDLTTRETVTIPASSAISDHALRDGSMRYVAPLVRQWVSDLPAIFHESQTAASVSA